MQRRADFDAPANDSALGQLNHWSNDLDACLGASSHAYQLLKYAVVLCTTIGVAGAIFGHCANPHRAGANSLRPAYRHGKEMRVAKRHVGNGNGRVAAYGSRGSLRH